MWYEAMLCDCLFCIVSDAVPETGKDPFPSLHPFVQPVPSINPFINPFHIFHTLWIYSLSVRFIFFQDNKFARIWNPSQ